MYKGVSGIVTFSAQNRDAILKVCVAQCSATRSAFRIMQKHPELTDNAIVQQLKPKYGKLNWRNLMAAVRQARILDPASKVIFGGKKAWDQLQNGEISTTCWREARDKYFYSIGERAKHGNPHFRIVGSVLKMKLPNSGRDWITGELKLYGRLPDYAQNCFTVQLAHLKGRKFKYHMCWEEPEQIDGLQCRHHRRGHEPEFAGSNRAGWERKLDPPDLH